MRLCFSLTLV